MSQRAPINFLAMLAAFAIYMVNGQPFFASHATAGTSTAVVCKHDPAVLPVLSLHSLIPIVETFPAISRSRFRVSSAFDAWNNCDSVSSYPSRARFVRFRAVAVVAESLKPDREFVSDEPPVKNIATNTRQVLSSMFGPIVFDVVDCKEFCNGFTARCARPSVMIEHGILSDSESFPVSDATFLKTSFALSLATDGRASATVADNTVANSHLPSLCRDLLIVQARTAEHPTFGAPPSTAAKTRCSHFSHAFGVPSAVASHARFTTDAADYRRVFTFATFIRFGFHAHIVAPSFQLARGKTSSWR